MNLISYIPVGTGDNPENRFIGDDFVRGGFGPIVDAMLANHRPVFDKVKARPRALLHNPGGLQPFKKPDGTTGGMMRLHQMKQCAAYKPLAHLPEDYYAHARRLIKAGWEVITYLGHGDGDDLPQGKKRLKYDLAALAPMLDDGHSIAIDSLGAASRTKIHPDVILATHLRDNGFKVYREAGDTKSTLFDLDVIFQTNDQPWAWRNRTAGFTGEIIVICPDDKNLGHTPTGATFATLAALGYVPAANVQKALWDGRDLAKEMTT